LVSVAVITLTLVIAGPSNAASNSRYDIVTTAERSENLKTFAAAVKAAGLEDVMREQNSYTVFAPTDEAFANLPEGMLDELLLTENMEMLREILTYHVVINKRIVSPRLASFHQLETVNRAMLDIWYTEDKVFIDNAFVVEPDIATKNGIIHVIDMVLPPWRRRG